MKDPDIYFDLRGVLESPVCPALMMTGRVRVNLEWAKSLIGDETVRFVAPGLTWTIKSVLAREPEYRILADRIDGSTDSGLDRFIAAAIGGKWAICNNRVLRRLRSMAFPHFIRHKIPRDVGRLVARESPGRERPFIYFLPYVQPLPSLPGGNCIFVMNVYDIIPLLFKTSGRAGDPDYCGSIESVRDQGGHFIVNSRYVRHSIISMFDIPVGNVHVVPLGTAPPPSASAKRPAEKALHPYFVHVSGDCQRRKNVEGTIRGFARFLDRTSADHELRIVGPEKDRVSALAASCGGRWKDRIVPMGRLKDGELEELLEGAVAGLYLSLHEGFGLPPLEAMKHGVPMICSSETSIPEVVGDAALLVDPLDEDAIAGAMQRITEDHGLARELSRKGLARAAQLSWEHSSDILLQTLRAILGQSTNAATNTRSQ